jgi:hypothetical protein
VLVESSGYLVNTVARSFYPRSFYRRVRISTLAHLMGQLGKYCTLKGTNADLQFTALADCLCHGHFRRLE